VNKVVKGDNDTPRVDIDKLNNELVEGEKKNQNISYISSQIEDAKEEIKKLQEKIDKWEARLKENKAVDLTDIRNQIKKWKEINELHDHNENVKQQEQVVGKLQKNWKEKDKQVKAIEWEKNQILKKANLPEGFDFTEDGIAFNGFPLNKDTLSSSQIYIASLKLASKSLWKVQTLTFDTSYIDKNSLKEVEERATANDLQLLIERPDYNGGEIKYEILS